MNLRASIFLTALFLSFSISSVAFSMEGKEGDDPKHPSNKGNQKNILDCLQPKSGEPTVDANDWEPKAAVNLKVVGDPIKNEEENSYTFKTEEIKKQD